MELEEAKEFMSLDDIIKMNKISGTNSVAGSSAPSRSTSQSRRGGFTARGAFTMGVAARPKNIDWVWTKEKGSLTKEPPAKFFHRGRGMMRGSFNFRRPQNMFFQRNPRYFVSARGRGGPKFSNQRGGLFRYPQYQRGRFNRFLGSGRWIQKRTLEQQLLPVHQRLGWTTPSLAQNVARNRVKVASWYLNKRNHSLIGQYQPTNYAPNLPNMLERRLIRQQKQQMSGMSSAASCLSVSVVNELANRGPFIRPRIPQRGGGGHHSVYIHGGVARLSKQNVAMLPNEGVFVHPNHSNRSQSFYSQRSYGQRSYARSLKKQRQVANRAHHAQPQLSITPGHAASLSSLSHQLNADDGPPGGSRATVHVVRLDQKLQSEITAIQRKGALNNGGSGEMVINVAGLDYRPSAFATTTSISDRFSVIAKT